MLKESFFEGNPFQGALHKRLWNGERGARLSRQAWGSFSWEKSRFPQCGYTTSNVPVPRGLFPCFGNLDPPGQKVFLHVPNRADIHSYRADYARNLYRELLSTSTPVEQLPKCEKYYCRKDAKGKVLSKPVMSQVSRALGHNRISVIASSYLYDL